MKRWTQRPEGSTWGDFGPDDELGRLNLLTEEKVLQAVREVRAGKVFCLSLPLDLPGGNVLNPRRHAPTLKPTFREGTPYLNFAMSQVQPEAVDVLSDDQVTLSMQYSTQWDGLCHVGALFDIQGDGQARRVYYNGYAAGVDVFGGADPDTSNAARPVARLRANSASAAMPKKACRGAACWWIWRAPSGRAAQWSDTNNCKRPCASRTRWWKRATCWCCAPGSPSAWSP